MYVTTVFTAHKKVYTKDFERIGPHLPVHRTFSCHSFKYLANGLYCTAMNFMDMSFR